MTHGLGMGPRNHNKKYIYKNINNKILSSIMSSCIFTDKIIRLIIRFNFWQYVSQNLKLALAIAHVRSSAHVRSQSAR